MVEKGYEPGTANVREDVHPALDNRSGSQRPPLESDPAVPQQVDGPDLLGQAEHAEAVARAEREADVARKGMFSPGDHGLSDVDVRDRGSDAEVDKGQANSDGLETDPGNPGSAPTGLDSAGPGATEAAGSRGATGAGASAKASDSKTDDGKGSDTKGKK